MTFHIISIPSKNYDVGFHVETCKIFKVPKHISEREKIELDRNILENNKDKINEINDIETFLDAKGDYKKLNFELYLMISQKCNMKCKYCYGSHGTYGDEGMMDFSTAKKAIEVFYENFRISGVSFFGGEPLLNFHLMRQVCEFISDYCNKKDIKMPIFATVTNGTIYSDEIKKLLNQFKISLTVSIDGQKEINDQLRIFPDGKGTTELVLKNISKFNYARKYLLVVELTFTKKHITNKFMYSTLIDYFMNLGVDGILFSPVILSQDDPSYESLNIDEKTAEEIREDISQSISKMISSLGTAKPIYNYLIPIVAGIIRQRVTSFCPSGVRKVVIDRHGDIYPCQMCHGKKDFYMGNIYDKNFPSDQFFKIIRLFLEHAKNKIKGNIMDCKDCWMRYLCADCVAGNMIMNNNIDVPMKTFCVFKKIEMETLLKELLTIHEDKVKHKHLLTNIANYFKGNIKINIEK